MSLSKNKIHAFVAKLGNRCFCWFPSAMLELIQVNNSMASLYYLNLYKWVQHFFGYLVYEIFLWPESWRGSLYMYLLSFPRFWTLSIERFWFLFWSILNGVTLKTSNTRVGCRGERNLGPGDFPSRLDHRTIFGKWARAPPRFFSASLTWPHPRKWR